MGVYIKGMKMPKEGYIDVRIKCNGTASFAIAENPYIKVVEAVSVPPHGRLIDADALAENHRGLAYELRGANYDFHMTACSWVNSAPAIIPTEEGEKNV